MSENCEFNFKKITEIIHADFSQHQNNIKELCVKASLISLSEFYDGYKREIKEINSEITPSRERPAIEEFQAIFAAFDEYPKNIQKSKRTTPKELQRLNSTLSVTDNSGLAESVPKDVQSSSASLPMLEECQQSSVEIYKNFKKFLQKLQLLLEEQKKGPAEEYAAKLQQLSVFARQLEKLFSTNRAEQNAFSAEEEDALLHLVSNMEYLNYIKKNRVLHQGVVNSNVARLESLVDVLQYALMSIKCYNSI